MLSVAGAVFGCCAGCSEGLVVLWARSPIERIRRHEAASAASQIRWPGKDREEWFSLGENHEKPYRFGLLPLRNCLVHCVGSNGKRSVGYGDSPR